METDIVSPCPRLYLGSREMEVWVWVLRWSIHLVWNDLPGLMKECDPTHYMQRETVYTQAGQVLLFFVLFVGVVGCLGPHLRAYSWLRDQSWCGWESYGMQEMELSLADYKASALCPVLSLWSYLCSLRTTESPENPGPQETYPQEWVTYSGG